MGLRNISLKCPGCGGSARATLNDVTIEEQATPVSTTVQKYRCPEDCVLDDEVIIAAAEAA